MDKGITIPIKTKNYWRDLVEIFDFIPPFSELRPRGKDVLALLFEKHYKYINLPERERNRLIFDYDTYQEIADKLSTENYPMNRQGILSLITYLRSKNFVIEDQYGHSCLNKKLIIPVSMKITFNLIPNDTTNGT